ncbi:MAG: response regulator, partial [bacterium]|nr:response regulator [bacterium]
MCAGIEILIDSEQLRRAVINIVSNALQDDESQGNQFSVSTHVTGDRLKILSSDTGCGIPNDMLDKIFEPLFSTKTFGVGLGISIVKEIMEKHGGGVEIQNPSTECISIEAEGLRTDELGQRRRKIAMNEATTSILVIEDEEILRESMADYLEDRDFQVMTAENGRMGLEVFTHLRPGLVLTDLRMPEMDGLEVLRRIVELSPQTPLIVVSGTGHIGDAVRALQLGAWDYILKPVEDMGVISHAVDKALERARLHRENREYQEHLETLVRKRTAELEQANTHLANINARLRKVVASTRCLSVCADIARFGSTLLDEFVQHMAASGGSVFLQENDGLRLLYTQEPNHVPEFIPYPLRDGSILKRAIEGKQPLLIQDIAQEHEVISSGWDGYRNGSALLFPLPDDTGRIIGVITLHSKTSPPFVEQDKEIGAILASYSCETLRAVRATETLRASEARFRDLADMLPEAIFETDRNLEVMYANQRTFELFGFAADDLSKRLTMLDLVAPEDRDRAQTNIARRSQGENPGTVEYQAIKNDGSVFPALFHASAIMQDDELCGFRSIVIDIIERKRMEQALRESEEHYRTLFESLPIPVFTKNREGKYTSCNT